MKLLSSLTVAPILFSTVILAADSPPAKTAAPETAASASIEQQLRQNPDNVSVWNQYMRNSFRPLWALLYSNPDEAQKRVDATRRFLDSLRPTQDEAKKMLARSKWTLGFWEQRIQLARTPRAELEAKLKAQPDDAATVSRYV